MYLFYLRLKLHSYWYEKEGTYTLTSGKSSNILLFRSETV